MGGTPTQARGVSYAIFGNSAMAEVLAAVEALAPEAGQTVTTREVATRTRQVDSVVRPALRRLSEAGLLAPVPKSEPRGRQYYRRSDSALWEPASTLAHRIRET